MGRRREKMKTCEYLCYLQSKRTRCFPARSDFPRTVGFQNATPSLVPVPNAPRRMRLFTRFIHPSAKERERENSCVCPNYFVTPTHEQTVYFWKLTPCSVNSSLTSGMGTDNLPERPRAHPLPSASLFSPRPASSCLFFCVQTKNTEDKLTETLHTSERCWKLRPRRAVDAIVQLLIY